MNTGNWLCRSMAVVLVLALAQSAIAHVVVYETNLSGPAEFPSNSSPGTGFARVTVDMDLATMRVEANFTGLTGNTSAAHIHGPIPDPPSNPTAGVATMTPSFAGFPLGVTSGVMDQTFSLGQASTYNPSFVTNNGGVSGAMQTFLNGLDDGKMYFNIHTSAFPAGEIRGFLVQVPEPASASLLALGALPLLARRRRR